MAFSFAHPSIYNTIRNTPCVYYTYTNLFIADADTISFKLLCDIRFQCGNVRKYHPKKHSTPKSSTVLKSQNNSVQLTANFCITGCFLCVVINVFCTTGSPHNEINNFVSSVSKLGFRACGFLLLPLPTKTLLFEIQSSHFLLAILFIAEF